MAPISPGVTAVTVSYHSGTYLPVLFESLASASSGPMTARVVNNAADDEPLDVPEISSIPISVIEARDNLGYGRAMNLGAAGATSEWLLIVNPDVTFTPGSVDELLRRGADDDSIGVVGPLIRTVSGEIYPSARKLPSLRTGIGHALFGVVWKSNPWTRSYLADRELPPRTRDAGWLSGACLLIRRSVFDEAGGFDDKYFMYFEDVDLCARIAKLGYRVLYAPTAEIVHSGAHATSASSKLMIRVHHESAYKYLAARYRAWYLAPVRAVLRIGLNARAAMVSR